MTQKAEKVSIKGHELSCPVCQHDAFFKKIGRREEFLYHTITFLNKEFVIYECENCTHLLWFNSWVNPSYK